MGKARPNIRALRAHAGGVDADEGVSRGRLRRGNFFELQHFGGDELADKNGFHGSPFGVRWSPTG
jgi:hypothetical protein